MCGVLTHYMVVHLGGSEEFDHLNTVFISTWARERRINSLYIFFPSQTLLEGRYRVIWRASSVKPRLAKGNSLRQDKTGPQLRVGPASNLGGFWPKFLKDTRSQSRRN